MKITTFYYDAHFSVAVAGTIGCSVHYMATLNGGKQGLIFVVVVAVSTNLKCEQTLKVTKDLPTVVFRICHVSESHPSRKDDNVPRQCHTLVHEEDGMRKLEEYNYHYAERHDTNTT